LFHAALFSSYLTVRGKFVFGIIAARARKASLSCLSKDSHISFGAEARRIWLDRCDFRSIVVFAHGAASRHAQITICERETRSMILAGLFDEDLFEKGIEKRKATLGAEYVEKNLAAADDFTRPFQEAMTAWCWGFGWGDDVIDPKTRSMMNLAMIGALGKMTEWETHCRGALNNGVSREEIRAIIHVVGIYCGVPQALECFRVARKVLSEADGR
jgi:4-carboxymuconolactone decarboxylase